MERAQQYQTGSTLPPVLHVTSRGRRLSNLRDVLAAETQVLRTKFTFEQVPLLVRRGLILLAIDGFDELVDADGYRDAWYALRDFLEEVGHGGFCVLAGRDTFFDQQGFLRRLESVASRIALTQAHLGPVKPADARAWLIECGWPTEEVNSSITDDILIEGSYALRPYFLSILGEARTWDALTQTSARAFLVDRFVTREAKLINQMVPIEQDDAKLALEGLFEEAAKDMAEREADTVDVEYLSFLCEVSFGGSLQGDSLRKLQHKIGSLGLMEVDVTPRMRRFPHSEIQHHFLGRAICREIIDGRIPLVLRRGVLGLDFLEVFQDVFESITAADAETFIKTLRAILQREISGDRLPQNGAALLLATLTRQLASDPRELRQLEANEASLVSASPRATLADVVVARLDARGADLREVQFENCQVPILIADKLTRFGETAPQVHLIHIIANGLADTLRSPEQVSRWLHDHMTLRAIAVAAPSVDHEGDEDLPLVRFFDRVCRRAIRQTYLKIGGDDPGAELLKESLWPEVENVLTEFSRIQRVVKSVGGPGGPLVHIKGPRRLLQPPSDDAESAAVRARIIERAKELEGS